MSRPRSGEVRELTVESLAAGGEGVARSEGFVLFVSHALPGERVRVRVEEVHARYARGELLEVLNPSAHRVVPPCPAYPVCGGCQLQELSYAQQLVWKGRWVAESLERIGGIRAPVRAVMGGPPWRYRSKAVFPAAEREGRPVLGPYRQGTHQVVPVEDCLLQSPLANAVLRAVRRLWEERRLSVYDEGTREGLLRHVLVRTDAAGAHALAVLVVAGSLPAGKGLGGELLSRVPGLVGVVENRQSARTNVVLGRGERVLAGEGALRVELEGLTFTVSPRSFFQVNLPQAAALYRTALEWAALGPGDTAVDAYCGTGTLALLAARRGARVWGLEAQEAAVADARRSAAANHLGGVTFLTGPAEDLLARVPVSPQVVLLDPPRAGCQQRFLEGLSRLSPRRIVYVSCNPATLARDLRRLGEDGWAVREVQPVDMFPQTAQVEAVAWLEREGAVW
ncbi:MAG: 23S rRNA (uracil(1939)-C(5))-methyltransferase RlmD [Thermaerobacter sp.]|nr:23S rRNA (uracil(1939)-C(5))-methyltransferase RlmD [Thermaerobacter sp.]